MTELIKNKKAKKRGRPRKTRPRGRTRKKRPVGRPKKIKKKIGTLRKKRCSKGYNNTENKFKDPQIEIYFNDCSKILSTFKSNSIGAIVTDPPYGIRIMNNRWDYDIPTTKIFKKMLSVLKPGGTLLCFASPRTQHRMASNIEDAGFELRDCLMWLFGGGFPKTQKINDLIKKNNTLNPEELDKFITMFEGYGTNSLKPAYEPIIMAMKPLDGNYAENAIKYGLSGLNIDECRLEDKGKKWEKPRGGIWKTDKEAKAILVDNTVGRFPANIIYEDSDDVRETLSQSIDPSMNLDKDFLTKIFYCAKVKGMKKDQNTHPTIKPLPLMQYLCRLVKSPSDCVILDPFMGSGTTGVACIKENIKFIGIEKEKEYFDIAKTRLTEEQTAISESIMKL